MRKTAHKKSFIVQKYISEQSEKLFESHAINKIAFVRSAFCSVLGIFSTQLESVQE